MLASKRLDGLRLAAIAGLVLAVEGCCCAGTPASCDGFHTFDLRCHDDPAPRRPDTRPPSDAGPRADAGPRPDAGPPPDTGPALGPAPGPCSSDAGVASVDDASSDDAGRSDDAGGVDTPRPPPGAYPIPFAPEPPHGTPVVLADDELSAPIPIGFSFRFFEATHTSLVVSSNGFVTFASDGTSSGCCSGHPIPMPDDADDVIAYGWTDLLPSGGGSLTHETRGVAPNRRFVLTATDQPWYGDSTGQPRVTAQIILRESTGSIEIHTTRLEPGRAYTQGVENATGCAAFFLPGRVAADFALANDGVLFVTH